MSYAEVAVNSPVAQRGTFSYSIPPGLDLKIGQAVWVPFGPRVLQGIVMELGDCPSVEETREVAGVIDPYPILSPVQIVLARWISERYLSPLFDAVALMLPPGFERRVLTYFHPAAGSIDAEAPALTTEQREVLNLARGKGRVEQGEIERALGRKRARQVIAQLLRRGLISRSQELGKVRVRPRVVTYLSLAVESAEAQREAVILRGRGRAVKQAALLDLLAGESQPIPLSRARREAGCSAAMISSLMGKGFISIEEVEVRRDPLSHLSFTPSPFPALTVDQRAAWDTIQASLMRSAQGNGSSLFLLHGVTGSGKTEIYLRALAQTIALGKKGIVLVPEIALTPQTIERFASRFPQRVAILHSKLSLGEQFDEWQRIRDGAFDVVIGSRSAIFAPQPDLGLIVIDEEHEWTYKQEDRSPRYHAREVAIKLAQLAGAMLIMGSATPDIESFYRSQAGEFYLLQLPRRFTLRGDTSLPQVEVVDLKDELKAGNRGLFSRSLSRAISETLAAQEQVILFLNRRGAASFVQCRNCGFVLRCRRCDVALTYHSVDQCLVCHHCNYRSAVPQVCPRCLSRHIRFLGIGTQRVEEEVGRLFPGARSLRWDRDVTRGKHSHETVLAKFLAHETDILIGTQMIAKGLDFPLVTLVGVVSADTSLHLPDFRAGERTFQILSQVAGRAGRGLLEGRVIVQTYTPEHYAILAAARHDYASFYHREINYRRQLRNPPLSRLARLVYSHANASVCQGEAERMSRLLNEERDSRGMPDLTIIGPAPAFVSRIRGRFRWQIILRGSDPSSLLAQIAIPRGWTIDIDPLGVL